MHNNAEHLPECIESVLAQTYANWDYTIVDNCSTDGSAEIAHRYAATNARIRVIENEHFLRAIPNHNRALRLISPASKHCKVVFADDWIFPECVEKMVAVAESYPSVGIVGAYALEGTQVRWTGLPYPTPAVSGREICREHLLRNLWVFGTANSVLYRSDLVRGHDAFYNEANIHADTEVCFELLKACDFGFVHQVLTFTRVRRDSLNTLSRDLQTHFPGGLQVLLMHGQDYLTREELGTLLDRHLSNYYRFLGKNLVMSRDKKFWEYHRKQLSDSGIGFSRGRLCKGMLAELFAALLNPGCTLERLRKRQHNQSVTNIKQNATGRLAPFPPAGTNGVEGRRSRRVEGLNPEGGERFEVRSREERTR